MNISGAFNVKIRPSRYSTPENVTEKIIEKHNNEIKRKMEETIFKLENDINWNDSTRKKYIWTPQKNGFLLIGTNGKSIIGGNIKIENRLIQIKNKNISKVDLLWIPVFKDEEVHYEGALQNLVIKFI